MRKDALIDRRTVLAGAAAACLPGIAPAQAAWPNRPVRIIDAAAPGGSTDVLSRLVGNALAPRLGQSFVVENKPGAGLVIGTDFVAKSPPDGYTYLMATTAMCTLVASGRKLPFDYLKDLVPVGQIATTPLIVVVPGDSPFKTLGDLVERARSQPEAVRFSSTGLGSMSHIGMELLAAQAKMKMLHVPYKGVSLSIPDLLSGQIHAAVGTVPTYAALLESGKMRALAVTASQRSASMPNVPTSAESGFADYRIEFFWGLMAPAATPAEIVRRMNSELAAVVALPETRAFLERQAASPATLSPEEFHRVNSFEINRWSKLIREANIKIE